MPVEMPSLDELLQDVHQAERRMRDLRPVWRAAHRWLRKEKRKEFKAGRGPRGPHRRLKVIRKGRRGSTPLYDTGDLMRSFSQARHPHHVWLPGQMGFEFGSSDPRLRRLKTLGFDLEGLTDAQYEVIDNMVAHYIETGEVRRP